MTTDSTSYNLTRRKFLTAATGVAASLASPAQHAFALPPITSQSPLRGRFVTHVSIVRVNQIEVTPTRNLGEDEAPLNSPKHTFAIGVKPSPPDGRAAR